MAKFIVKGSVKYKGVFYASGSVAEVEEKDVKEFKNRGWELAGKAKQANPEDQDPNKVPAEKVLTKDNKKEEIIAELEKRGIEFDPAKNKAELLALLA